MNHDPLVSVIIPVYNGEAYLAQAIESVRRQPYQPIELIVVDDGSTDGSAEIAKGFDEVRYCFQPQSGAAAARNQGIRLAQGTFLAFLDADDLWTNDKLSRQLAVFDHHPALDMLFAQVKQFHSPELDQETKKRLPIPAHIMPGYHLGTMLIKRDAFFRVGQFETRWRVGEFIDWYAKAIELGLKSQMLPEVLMKRRLHLTSLGTRERKSQTDYLHILKAALDRRRQKKATIREEKDQWRA
ncbi:MAG: glycosyltransferase family 2 protein [Ardenticatenaceae bacterium]